MVSAAQVSGARVLLLQPPQGEEEGGEEGGPAPQDSGHQGEAALLGGDLQGGDEEAHQTGDQARQADGLHAGGYPSRKDRGRMGAY